MDILEKRKTLRFTVLAEQAGLRLDQFLPEAEDDLSRGAVRKLIDLGGVHLDGRRVRKNSIQVREGSRIEVNIDGLPLKPYILQSADIVYQDNYLLVLNKPAGIDSQPTPSRYKGTLYAAVVDYLRDPRRKDLQPSVGMVQRLDRETSGLVVFSIHPAGHKKLTGMFSERAVTKKYRALVAGRIKVSQGEYRSLLARRRATNTMKSVDKGGQEAITRYRLLAATDEVSYVEVEIPTGRSHQIRAHFSEAGHPLLGDVRYGGPAIVGDSNFARQMLHARELSFNHPKTDEKLDFLADLPYDMKSFSVSFFEGVE